MNRLGKKEVRVLLNTDSKSWSETYANWLEKHAEKQGYGVRKTIQLQPLPNLTEKRVGIIGGGMAGLYAGLILRREGVPFHILEANDRLGGRVFTHRFGPEKGQYLEAGAMRIPHVKAQQPVFSLIEWLNSCKQVPDSQKINLITYYLNDDNNFVYVNGARQKDGQIMTLEYANKHPEELNFPLHGMDKKTIASELLNEAIKPFLDLYEKAPERAIEELMKYDDYTL